MLFLINTYRLTAFIGLAWGKAEPDTSEIDYYQMGIDAANDDLNSRSYYVAGCTVYGLCLIPVIAIAPVKIIRKGTFHLISAAGVSYALFIVFLKAGGINLFYK